MNETNEQKNGSYSRGYERGADLVPNEFQVRTRAAIALQDKNEHYVAGYLDRFDRWYWEARQALKEVALDRSK